jgi:sigma-B regulation protein RsbU (phosphoserine phosphatase)
MTMTIERAMPTETTAAERDVATAGQLQRILLPPSPFIANGWTATHRFEPAGIVSGDYLDVVSHGGRVYFMLGDVSGKGVAASLLMAQLHAMFRTLIPFELSLDELMTRASALLCASSLPAQYATLVSGYLDPDGVVVIANAGHPPPLAITGQQQRQVQATGVPIGMFCESQLTSTQLRLDAGDTLLLFTDGLTEATNPDGVEYGARVEDVARRAAHLPLADLVSAVMSDQAGFRNGSVNTDDLTVLAIRRC